MDFSYDNFRETMKNRNITTYRLYTGYNISKQTIQNLKDNKSITINTLINLCEILQCTPNDIITLKE